MVGRGKTTGWSYFRLRQTRRSRVATRFSHVLLLLLMIRPLLLLWVDHDVVSGPDTYIFIPMRPMSTISTRRVVSIVCVRTRAANSRQTDERPAERSHNNNNGTHNAYNHSLTHPPTGRLRFLVGLLCEKKQKSGGCLGLSSSSRRWRC
jgi:hypothetical protein